MSSPIELSKTIIPSFNFGSPNSVDEQIIPFDSTPLSFAALILKSFPKIAPIVATATVCPASTFEAPQTIWVTSSPKSTWQTFNLSASGCFSLLKTFATTTFEAILFFSTLSTSKPMLFNVLQISSVLIFDIFINSSSHLLVIII